MAPRRGRSSPPPTSCYATDRESPFHEPARTWMEGALSGSRRVGIPWVSLTASVRIVTNPRAVASPLAPSDAWRFVDEWLDVPVVWVPSPDAGTAPSSAA
jgi:uncharacterized protein